MIRTQLRYLGAALLALPLGLGSANARAEDEISLQNPSSGGEYAHLELLRLELALTIEEREPVHFAEGCVQTNDEVSTYAFLQVNNPEEEVEVRVLWTHTASGHTHEQTLTVGVSPSWRTWGRHRLWEGKEGDWSIQVFAPDDTELGRIDFLAKTPAECGQLLQPGEGSAERIEAFPAVDTEGEMGMDSQDPSATDQG